jgi:hypothetical protein
MTSHLWHVRMLLLTPHSNADGVRWPYEESVKLVQLQGHTYIIRQVPLSENFDWHSIPTLLVTTTIPDRS